MRDSWLALHVHVQVHCLVLTFLKTLNLMDVKSGPVSKTLNIMDANLSGFTVTCTYMYVYMHASNIEASKYRISLNRRLPRINAGPV